MPNSAYRDKFIRDRTVAKAAEKVTREMPQRSAFYTNNQQPVSSSSSGVWTNDDDGNPEFVEFWCAGDVIASAPIN